MQGNTVNVIYPYNSENDPLAIKGLITKETVEKQAYNKFIHLCGHEKYAQKINKAIDEANQSNTIDEIILLGFSVGASAIWKAIGTDTFIKTKAGCSIETQNKIKHFVGFYSSQIRNNLELDPSCPTTLIFPKQEDHFDIDIVIENIIDKKMVTVFKVKALHGFMNPISKNYCKINAEAFNKILIKTELLSSKNDFVKAIKNSNLS